MIVECETGVTLVGGGQVRQADLDRALRLAPCLVAADGGADRCLRLGQMPRAVIGDMDSIGQAARAALAGRMFAVPEQETTDFDKALRHTSAPFVLGLGFSGARADHALAVLNSLVRHPDRRALILSPWDVTFLCPADLTLDLAPGTRLSLFPMGPCRGQSEGLRWPIGGIHFAPDGPIGTSNEVTEGTVRLRMEAATMLVVLPVRSLAAVLAGFGFDVRPGSPPARTPR